MTFVLLHSPLLAADGTWGALPSFLPDESVVVRVEDDLEPPFARRYVDRAVAQVHGGRVSLVAHSGAGPLVPAIAAALSEHGIGVDTAVFVDAGLPAPGRSRLESLAVESPGMASEFEALLADGGVYPDWTANQLGRLVPDPDAVLAAVRPRREDFWREPLPKVELPADLRCGYVQLSAAYETSAEAARGRGWPTAHAELSHFAMLSEPAEVAALIREVL